MRLRVAQHGGVENIELQREAVAAHIGLEQGVHGDKPFLARHRGRVEHEVEADRLGIAVRLDGKHRADQRRGAVAVSADRGRRIFGKLVAGVPPVGGGKRLPAHDHKFERRVTGELIHAPAGVAAAGDLVADEFADRVGKPVGLGVAVAVFARGAQGFEAQFLVPRPVGGKGFFQFFHGDLAALKHQLFDRYDRVHHGSEAADAKVGIVVFHAVLISVGRLFQRGRDGGRIERRGVDVFQIFLKRARDLERVFQQGVTLPQDGGVKVVKGAKIAYLARLHAQLLARERVVAVEDGVLHAFEHIDIGGAGGDLVGADAGLVAAADIHGAGLFGRGAVTHHGFGHTGLAAEHETAVPAADHIVNVEQEFARGVLPHLDLDLRVIEPEFIIDVHDIKGEVV